VVGGVAGDGRRVGGRLDLVEVAGQQLQAADGGMDVGVVEAGQHQPAAQPQHPGGRAAERGDVALGADGGDPAGPDGDRVGPAPRRVGGVHRRADHQQVGGPVRCAHRLGSFPARPVVSGVPRSRSTGVGWRRSATDGQSTMTSRAVAAMVE
jgi:hypothetical protein